MTEVTIPVAIEVTEQQARVLRRIKDIDGNYLWQPSMIAGEPDTFMGIALEMITEPCCACRCHGYLAVP